MFFTTKDKLEVIEFEFSEEIRFTKMKRMFVDILLENFVKTIHRVTRENHHDEQRFIPDTVEDVIATPVFFFFYLLKIYEFRYSPVHGEPLGQHPPVVAPRIWRI